MLADHFGRRVAGLVAAVTNPAYEPGRDQHEQYRGHVGASLRANPWARVIKVSDFTNNAVGLMHASGPQVVRLATKYRPLVPVLQKIVLLPDTPLRVEFKGDIVRQLGNTERPFASILD